MAVQVESPDGAMIFRGLRMKMGISFSSNVVKRPSARGRADYAGAFFNICAASVQVASPGQARPPQPNHTHTHTHTNGHTHTHCY